MTSPQEGSTSVRAQIAEALNVKEYVVKRDRERPFAFAGVLLASESIENTVQFSRLRAAVYRTQGGKFISTFSRESTLIPLSDLMHFGSEQLEPNQHATPAINKAEVFDTLDEAADWFRPGRLTNAIRKKLGVDEPIRIE